MTSNECTMKTPEQALEPLFEYCNHTGIAIHPSIRPKYVKGCGLGVYATEPIAPGKEIVHVPTSQIFTTSTIPETFLSNTDRENIAVHAQLAAYFAFADEDELKAYQPWMQTWPALEDFHETMPIFWGEDLAQQLRDHDDSSNRQLGEPEYTSPASKRRKTESSFDSPPRTRCKTKQVGIKVKSLSVLHQQVTEMNEKLASHLISISEALPDMKLLTEPDNIVQFLHAWCLINTRCFYYVPTVSSKGKASKDRPKVPADPNEAMGLCPFMDLFNHTSSPPSTAAVGTDGPGPPQLPCKVRSNSTGFVATTASEIAADTEIVFSYGAHTNDTLWSEYGFLLSGSSNTSDATLLDRVILDGLTAQERAVLDERDYLGTYTLFNDGSVCYRTEMVAWLKVLGSQLWTRAVEESLDPIDLVSSVTSRLQTGSFGSSSSIDDATSNAKAQHCEVIKTWLVATQDQAREDSKVLRSLKESAISESYETLSIVAKSIRQTNQSKLAVAKVRHQMCLSRCEQIQAMASRGVEVAVADAAEEM